LAPVYDIGVDAGITICDSLGQVQHLVDYGSIISN
jgi:hypothetical protein